MGRPSFIWRFLCVLLAIIGLASALGWSLGGLSWASAGASLAVAFLVGLLIRAEGILVRRHRDLAQAPSVLRAVLMRTAARTGVRMQPKLLLAETPFSNAIVLRSLGSKGTLIVTQGLLTLLTERELEEVFGHLLRRNQTAGLVARTWGAGLAVYLLKILPPGWMKLVLAGETRSDGPNGSILAPASALGFLAVFPLAWPLLDGSSSANPAGSDSGVFIGAMQKVACSAGSSGPEDLPSAAALYLVNPWRDRMLLPFSARER